MRSMQYSDMLILFNTLLVRAETKYKWWCPSYIIASELRPNKQNNGLDVPVEISIDSTPMKILCGWLTFIGSDRSSQYSHIIHMKNNGTAANLKLQIFSMLRDLYEHTANNLYELNRILQKYVDYVTKN
jgi:hypothetical protein